MFRPLHAEADLPGRGAFRPDARYGAKPAPVAPARPRDALAEAWDEGFRAGSTQARADVERDTAAIAQLAQACAQLAAGKVEIHEAKLRETVIALCGTVLEAAAIDPDLLLQRIDAALALLRRSTDGRVLRLHPDDLALLAARLPADLEARADSTLERGALRLETAAGGVEDGPAQWREAIEAAVRSC